EKLKDKKADYEVVASSDSSVHLDDIDNQIITEVLGLESKLLNLKRRQHREKLRFKENMKNSSYNLKQMQQRGKQRQQREKLRFKENMKNSSYNLKQIQQRGKQRQQREKLRFKENMKNSSYNLKQMQQRGKQRQQQEKHRLQRGKQSRAESRRTPTTASEYDEDVSAVATSAIIDYRINISIILTFNII
ncbi:hypothetical protein Gotri_013054, partial [Gossypium trilobum]|nr:hypothetical protein [Gossypium trilobum]